jgi:Isochorismatase family
VPAHSRFAPLLATAGPAMHSDSPATAIHDAVAPEPGDIIVRKTRVGAFSTTDLDQQLRDRGIINLILAGISTSGVVLSTVRDAADRDYQVLVLADASADPVPGVHEFLTEKIFPRQAHVITIAALKDLLAGPVIADSIDRRLARIARQWGSTGSRRPSCRWWPDRRDRRPPENERRLGHSECTLG